VTAENSGVGRNRSSCAGLAAGVLGLLCAGVLSACLNPIPDDFPNGHDRELEDDRGVAPQPTAPGTEGDPVPGASSGGGPEGDGQTPAEESPVIDDDSPPASAAPPDAGAPDAGVVGGTGSGG
jgi:hypothetical protein